MKIWVRNLTKNLEKSLTLPMDGEELKKVLGKDEWIILDSESALRPDEMDSITELNDFLNECKELGVCDDVLGILSVPFLYCEVMEMIRAESWTIINFDNETGTWDYGNGGNFWDDSDKGRVLHDCEYVQFDWERKYPIVEEMEDDIEWENLWTTAQCLGWREVTYKGYHYLVHR